MKKLVFLFSIMISVSLSYGQSARYKPTVKPTTTTVKKKGATVAPKKAKTKPTQGRSTAKKPSTAGTNETRRRN